MCKKPNGIHNRIDNCMRNLISALNVGVETLGCCCGHGKYPMTIVCKDLNGVIYELMSDTVIPRKRKFYKKDEDGYYYVPECVKIK